jgi:hypothetical protein
MIKELKFLFSVLGGKGQKRLMVFCFMLVVTGGLIQYEKLVKIENSKDGKVEDHVSFFAFAGIMMTAAGLFGFGRQTWPFFTQLFALCFTFVVARRAPALLDWWDKTTLLLMMLSLVGMLASTDDAILTITYLTFPLSLFSFFPPVSLSLPIYISPTFFEPVQAVLLFPIIPAS